MQSREGGSKTASGRVSRLGLGSGCLDASERTPEAGNGTGVGVKGAATGSGAVAGIGVRVVGRGCRVALLFVRLSGDSEVPKMPSGTTAAQVGLKASVEEKGRPDAASAASSLGGTASLATL